MDTNEEMKDLNEHDLKEYDKNNMKATIDDFPNQVKQALQLASGLSIDKSERIYWFGMGGSAIAGMMLKSYLYESLDVRVINGYEIPPGIRDDDLLIFCSYSGNTEETLASYKQAARNHDNILSLSVGGKLQELSEVNRRKHVKLPEVKQPRNSLAMQLIIVLRMLETSGKAQGVSEEIKNLLEKINVPVLSKHGFELSEKLKDKLPIIYASKRYYPIAYRWKCEINENAKHMAFSNELPELNHNEILGYTMLKNQYHGVMMRFDDDHRRVQKRMDLMKDVMKRAGVEVTEIGLKGRKLTKMFTAILIGDYASLYLGLRYKVNPEPVVLIERFKKDMGPMTGF